MSDSDRARIRAYYASFGEREWERLERPADGAVEFSVTTAALVRHLPDNARILDLGGGPGRYAIWLAQLGHIVSLADLSPEQLSIARRRVSEAEVTEGVAEIVEVDASDLSRWDDHSFDAVLSLGPFYHLSDAAERGLAARQQTRVVRPGGLVFVALIPRYAFIRRTLALADERHHLLDPVWVRRLLEDGVFDNEVPGRFSLGYGFRPEEVEPFFARYGLAMVELLAAEGLAAGIPEAVGEVVEAGGLMRDITLRLIAESAGDPALLGGAGHLLYVGRRV